MTRKAVLKNQIQTLPPSYFALVMATGIVSQASWLQQFFVVGRVLFWINNLLFFVLLLLFVLRLLLFFPDLVRDLSSHAKGAGFLTLVAGACMLGTGYAQIKQNYPAATILAFFGIGLWMVFIYSFLASVILKKKKPSPETGMNGIWLLLVVSTQSLSILWCEIAPHQDFPQAAFFVSMIAFLLGLMLYIMLIPIDLYRLAFFPVKPEEVVPSYWINMGAAAITTVAGTLLFRAASGDPVFRDFCSFIKTATLLFWSVGSFWIPVILIMEIWRYVYKKSPLKYEPDFWSIVFPLGMYTVCTRRLAVLVPLAFLLTISKAFIYIAWAAWLMVFLALCSHLVKRTGLRKRSLSVFTRYFHDSGVF